MTTATRDIPDHGTPARGNGIYKRREPCRCEPCLIAVRAARKRRTVNRQLGRAARVDAGPAREHLRLLHQTMGWSRLETATGCSYVTLFRLYDAQRKNINRTTHNKIMAVRPVAQRDRGAYIDATGTIRRIRALQAIGHSCPTIAAAAETTAARIQKIGAGIQPTVRQHIADKIAAAYVQLAYKTAPPGRATTRTRNLSAAKGWHGPLAWDGNIDDPTAVPDVENPPEPEIGRDELAQQRREEVWLLRTAAVPKDQIAARVGISPETVRVIVAEFRTGKKQTRGKQAVTA